MELSLKQLFIIFSIIILSCFAQADTAAASEFLKLHRAESSPGLLVDGLPKADNNIKDSIINGPLYIVSNYNLETLNFPNLKFVNGPIYIVYNYSLRTVNFPKLEYVNGPIYITYNGNLIKLNYPRSIFVNGPIYQYGN